MSDLLAALRDLYSFAREIIFGRLGLVAEESAVTSVESLDLLKCSEVAPTATGHSDIYRGQDVLGLRETGYTTGHPTKIFSRPVWAFDTVIGEFPYGTTVNLLGYQGRFAHISSVSYLGYILKDELATVKEDIWPKFESDATYLATTETVGKVRSMIGDSFFAAELYLPLSTEEFITYRLKERGLDISWGIERPRSAGFWHELLKGRPGVFTVPTVSPKLCTLVQDFQSRV